MAITRQIWLVLVLLTAFCLPKADAQIQMEVTADTNRMMIGDRQKLTFTITCDPSIEITGLALDSITRFEGFELSDEKDWIEKKTSMSRILTKEIMLTVFNPGEYDFPEVPYHYTYQGKEKTGHSRSWRLSVLPLNTQEPDIAPNKDIIEETYFFEKYKVLIISALSLILLTLAGIWYFRKYKKSQPSPGAVQITVPPATEARRALHQLRESGSWRDEDHKPFQTQLSSILRTYLQDEFSIPAYNRTSHEIIKTLQKRNFPYSIVETTDKALNIADLVKFANARSREEINFSFIEKVEKLIGDAELFKDKTLQG